MMESMTETLYNTLGKAVERESMKLPQLQV